MKLQTVIDVFRLLGVPETAVQDAVMRLAPHGRLNRTLLAQVNRNLTPHINFSEVSRMDPREIRELRGDLHRVLNTPRGRKRAGHVSDAVAAPAPGVSPASAGGAAPVSALIDWLQDVPVPEGLVQWHRTRFDAFFMETLTNPRLFDAAQRIFADSSLGEEPGELESALDYIHERMAFCWGTIRPTLLFKQASEMRNMGDAHVHERNAPARGWRYEFENRARLHDNSGRAYTPETMLDTVAHEFAHSIEDWLVLRVLGRGHARMHPAQKPYFTTGADNDPLASAGILFALNSPELGKYISPERFAQHLYNNQLRERHVNWFALQCCHLLEDCATTYGTAFGGPMVAPAAMLDNAAYFLRSPHDYVHDWSDDAYLGIAFEMNVDHNALAATLERAHRDETALPHIARVMRQYERVLQAAERSIRASYGAYINSEDAAAEIKALKVVALEARCIAASADMAVRLRAGERPGWDGFVAPAIPGDGKPAPRQRRPQVA